MEVVSLPGSPGMHSSMPAGSSGSSGSFRQGRPAVGYTPPPSSPDDYRSASEKSESKKPGPKPGSRKPGQAPKQQMFEGEEESSPLGAIWRRPRLQVRSVRRILRRVELWSVLKLSLIFYFCMWAILLVAGVILWNVVDSLGYVEATADFIARIFALEEFEFNARQIFRVYALGGLAGVLGATLFNVVAAVFFNLISELVGGIRIVLIEEESTRFRPARRFQKVRRK